MTKEQIDALVSFVRAASRTAAVQVQGCPAPHAEAEELDAEFALRSAFDPYFPYEAPLDAEHSN